MQSPRSMSPRSSLLSASPRRQYRVAPHGRAAWQTNYPPFANPELAMKTAMERNVQARPWLHGSMVAGSNTPIAPISPRQMGKLAPVSIDRVPVPVPAPRRAKEMPFVPTAPLADRWEEALTARRPGQRKEKTVQRIFERIDKDRSGTISHEEAFKSILANNLKVKPGEIDAIIRASDTNGDGVLDFDEFRLGIMRLTHEKDGTTFGLANRPKQAMVLKHDLAECTGTDATDAEINHYMQALRDQIETKYKLLRKAFMAADSDSSGFLSKSELVDVVQHFALPIPVSHIHQIFDEILDTVTAFIAAH